MAIFLSLALPEFLSTPSARRATNLDSVISQLFRFLSTPSARRATTSSSQKYCPDCQFLSTPSARRATYHEWYGRIKDAISIHALREEGDREHFGVVSPDAHFYPRPPRGGRPGPNGSKPPAGQISIHALREEGDLELALLLIDGGLFLSTPSARRATLAFYCI